MQKPGNDQRAFSAELQEWLETGKDKTLAGLINVFAEKSFAILFFILLALPALPIPTAGLTHVTELIAMLLCLELIIGRRAVWLPKRWLKLNVGKVLKGKAVPRLIGVIRWFERFSRHRGSGLLAQSWMLALIGIVVFLFSAAALVAIPFSNLDTLPALGVVLISLSLILEDVVFLLVGILIGAIGVALEISVGLVAFKSLIHFF